MVLWESRGEKWENWRKVKYRAKWFCSSMTVQPTPYTTCTAALIFYPNYWKKISSTLIFTLFVEENIFLNFTDKNSSTRFLYGSTELFSQIEVLTCQTLPVIRSDFTLVNKNINRFAAKICAKTFWSIARVPLAHKIEELTNLEARFFYQCMKWNLNALKVNLIQFHF